MSVKVDVLRSDGVHSYWSTHCRHGNHRFCKNACKGCGTPCICADPDCTHRAVSGTDAAVPEPCCQDAVHMRLLGDWLTANLPGAARDGETPADTAIRVLLVAGHGARMLASAAQAAVVPFVSLLRNHGLDVLPDGLTIPAKETPRP